MQWLYNLLHGAITSLFAYYGRLWWLFKNAYIFQITVITAVFAVGVLFWRMFHFGITTMINAIDSIPTLLADVSSIVTVGDMLDLANFLFPVEECFSMISVLISYGVVCLSIRIIRSFIPTMT